MRPVDGPGGAVDFVFIAANTRSLAVNRRPIIRALQARGLRVGALVPDEDFLNEVHALGVQTWPYSLDRHGIRLTAEVRRFIELRRLIRRIAPAAVMGYAMKPIILGVPAARLAGVRETYCLATGLGYLFGRQDRKARLLRWVATYFYGLSGALSRAFFLQNPDDQADLQKNWLFRWLTNAVVVNGSGVDVREFPYSEAPSDPPTFLFMGRFLEEKGISDFVAAACEVRSDYPEARFIALGSHDPSLVNSISERELASWKIEGVVDFPGRVRDVSRYLRGASAVVLPSHYREGIPRALLEALSMGRAIITCDTPGCRETVENGVNGWLVPPRAPRVLAERMRRLLRDPTLFAQMGRRGRAMAEARFTVERVSAQMLAEMPIGRAAANGAREWSDDAHSSERLRLLDELRTSAPEGARWAIRGGDTGIADWLASARVKDIDLWVPSADLESFCTALTPHIQAVISLESDPRWLRHVVFVMSEDLGEQLVDVTYGDLKVGGVSTCREALIDTVPQAHGPRLEGVSAISDLVLRKFLRGRSPVSARLEEARSHWNAAAENAKAAWLADLRKGLGQGAASRVEAILNGRAPKRRDALCFAVSAMLASLRAAGPRMLMRRRRRIAPGRRGRTPFKRPVAPVLVRVADAREAETLAHRITRAGASAVVARKSAGVRTLVAAAFTGRAVIAVNGAAPRTMRALGWLFGPPLRVGGNVGGLSTMAAYWLAAHRWYIDDSSRATALCVDAAGAGPRSRTVATEVPARD